MLMSSKNVLFAFSTLRWNWHHLDSKWRDLRELQLVKIAIENQINKIKIPVNFLNQNTNADET